MTGKLGAFAGLAALVVVLDQLTKVWVESALRLYESVPVIDGLLHLTHVRNPGAAFGIFAGQSAAFRQPFFIGVTVVALVVITIAMWRTPANQRWFCAALALVFGGAVGNLIDRIRYGEVVDFIDVFWRQYHWPAFNVADSAISVGMTLIIALELLRGRQARGTDEQQAAS